MVAASGATIRRFWREAALREHGAKGFRVELDGKPVRTPMAAVLTLPVPRYAAAVADEWAQAGDGQGAIVSVEALPLTRIACSAQDRVASDPEAFLGALLRVGGSDLLCYRADHPPALVQRQAALWQPLLDWAELAFDARLVVTTGLMPVAQDEQALAALRLALADEPPLRLAAIGLAVEATGSLILALALARGRIDAVAADQAASLDDRFSLETWGEDEEARARLDRIAADIATAERALRLADG